MSPEQFESILRSMPERTPQTFRLYHDQHGKPLCYSMDDLPGTWIEIDQADFVRSSPWVRVRNGRLEHHKPWLSATKLRPALSGTACSLEDVAIVVDGQDHQKWSVNQNDTD